MTFAYAIELFAPWLVVFWMARRFKHQMKFLERQLEHLSEATAAIAARQSKPQDVQKLVANANPPEPEPEPEPEPLPVATARFIK